MAKKNIQERAIRVKRCDRQCDRQGPDPLRENSRTWYAARGIRKAVERTRFRARFEGLLFIQEKSDAL